MAVFAASFTVSQSADCTTLTFTDTSNYVTNDEGYAVSSFDSRQFIIKDSTDEIVDTIALTGSAVSGSYAITQDYIFNVELSLTNTSPALDYSDTHNVLSTCYLELCFAELVTDTECGCGCNGSSCNCDSTCNDKVRLLEYIKAAQIFAQYSNPVLCQKQLDAGTALCNANENN